MRWAFTHGRYQPFHLGHFTLVKRILEEYDRVYIGISNPHRTDGSCLIHVSEELRRDIELARAPEKNPFNYIQRSDIITAALLEEGVSAKRFRVMPHYAYYDGGRWQDFMPPMDLTTIVLAVKDGHHLAKLDFYEKHGWKTQRMDLIPGYSETDFHRAWPHGDWRSLVPRGAIPVLEQHLRLYPEVFRVG